MARNRLDIVLAGGGMQHGLENDPNRIGKPRRRVGDPGRKVRRPPAEPAPRLSARRRVNIEMIKLEASMPAKTTTMYEVDIANTTGLRSSPRCRTTRPRPGSASLADLRAEIMELGDKKPEENSPDAAQSAIEEGRDQSSGGAFVRQGRHDAIDYRNHISRQNSEQNAGSGKQSQWSTSSSHEGLCGVSCAFRSRHAEKAHGVDLGEAGDGEAGGQGRMDSADREYDLDRR